MKARVVGRKLELYVTTFVSVTFHTVYVNVQDANNVFVCSVIKRVATTVVFYVVFFCFMCSFSILFRLCTSVVLFGGPFVSAQ